MGRLNVSIDEDLHRKLKSQVALEGTTICRFITDAIIEKLGLKTEQLSFDFMNTLDKNTEKEEVKPKNA